MRYLTEYIKKDLAKKMVFIGGPRQVGKTTLAEFIRQQPSFDPSLYLNWDNPDHRLVIQRREWPTGCRLIVFDELHKMKKWKTWIKGIYDVQKASTNFLVTGSARMDVYRKGGDSLQGRYHHWRLHPLTIDERPSGMTAQDCYQRLMRVGGFPEPFFADDPIEAARWRRERYERFVKEDIRDLEAVKDLQTLSFYAELLKERVRWPIALSNLAADLEVAPATAKHWLGVFEAMHYVFVCRPFTYKLSRSVHKQPKVYFFDNAEVPDQSARLENLVATHLLKRVHFLQDALGLDVNLHFLRDKEGREVDFAITRGRRVEELYEVKVSDRNPDPNLLYYARKLRPRACYQVVGDLDKSFVSQDVRFVSPSELFDQPLSTLVQVFGAS
jgi:uncharacterized protein